MTTTAEYELEICDLGVNRPRWIFKSKHLSLEAALITMNSLKSPDPNILFRVKIITTTYEQLRY